MVQSKEGKHEADHTPSLLGSYRFSVPKQNPKEIFWTIFFFLRYNHMEGKKIELKTL